MPEFLSRPLEWFRDRPDAQKALIGAGILVIMIAARRPVQVIASAVFVVGAVGFLIQLARRKPTRGWMILALGSLAVAVLFGAVDGAIFGS